MILYAVHTPAGEQLPWTRSATVDGAWLEFTREHCAEVYRTTAEHFGYTVRPYRRLSNERNEV